MCLTLRKEHPAVQQLINYLIGRAATNPTLSPLENLLKSSDTTDIGLVLTEKLINIPSEVVPPMYKMLVEEVSWALEEKEPYNFTHYLVLSKTYQEMEVNLDQVPGMARKTKKQKSDASNNTAPSIFYFHPEDEVLQRYAKLCGGYDYVQQEKEGHPDSTRTSQDLVIRAQGHLMLIETEKFGPAVKALEK
jgi:protein BCP1